MAIKTNDKKRALVFGDFVIAAYGAYGTRGAKGLVRLFVNEHLLTFRGRQRFVISEA
jgi:hypothetical protein